MRVYGGMTAEQRIVVRRQRLIESAVELFSTQGYARTSVRALLRHAGLQDRYFAESFASLDDVMAAIVGDIWEEQLTACAACVETRRPPRERAREMIEALVGTTTADPRKSRVKFVEALSAGPLTAEVRRRGLRRMSALVEALLRESHVDPRINTTAMSVAIVGGVGQLLMNWVDGTLRVSGDELVDQGFLLFEAVAGWGAPE
ncbi:TetR/AcrR family transcriptional regulator [Streptomyces sp. NPDC089424]|uniref:TetR/AcrR family transcriptional regulator n=1 Tax=Streptomyces sp. NPDC089424 TaxID=3365917 RepID=UPI0038219647